MRKIGEIGMKSADIASEKMAEPIYISVIIPFLNEEETLVMLYNQVLEQFRRLSVNGEIIFVDDGSTDNAYNILKALSKNDEKLRLIKFRRNFGKAAALSVGFEMAKGEIVITMDADLQDDPEEIGKFISKINEGFDVVSGWKVKRYDPLSKTIPSKLFNKTISILSGVKLHDFNCGFKAYRNEVIKGIHIYGELHRYIPAIAYAKGYKVAEIGVRHHPRKYGKSKYGLERFTRGFFDCMTVVFLSKYLSRPLHFFGKAGLLSSFIGTLLCLYLTFLKLFCGQSIGNRPMLSLGILMLIIGVQFISTGLIGELIINVQPNFTKQTYEIEKIINS